VLPLRRSALALCIGVALAGAVVWANAQASPPKHFDDAMLEYEVGHYAQAYAGFATLADQGHAEAARLAWQMWRYGPQLYHQRFVAEPAQLSRWQRLHRCAGRIDDLTCRHISSPP
jgi:hypothetical protein